VRLLSIPSACSCRNGSAQKECRCCCRGSNSRHTTRAAEVRMACLRRYYICHTPGWEKAETTSGQTAPGGLFRAEKLLGPLCDHAEATWPCAFQRRGKTRQSTTSTIGLPVGSPRQDKNVALCASQSRSIKYVQYLSGNADLLYFVLSCKSCNRGNSALASSLS
jgi:hypothetical protein